MTNLQASAYIEHPVEMSDDTSHPPIDFNTRDRRTYVKGATDMYAFIKRVGIEEAMEFLEEECTRCTEENDK